MEFRCVISVQDNEQAVKTRIANYFVRVGYKEVGNQGYLTYQRGSTLGTWFGLSPKNWKTQANVSLTSSGSMINVSVWIEINATGQMVTKGENSVFESEFAALQAVIRGEKVDLKSIAGKARASLAGNFIVFAAIIALTIIGAVIAYGLFGVTLALLPGGIVGLFIGGAFALFVLDIDPGKSRDALKVFVLSTIATVVMCLVLGSQNLSKIRDVARRVPGEPRNPYEEMLLQQAQTSQILVITFVVIAFSSVVLLALVYLKGLGKK
jgi:hypothetical protein